MKNTLLVNLMVLILMVPVLFTSCKDEKDDLNNDTPTVVNTKVMVASDPHLFDPSLLIADGVAFQTYLAQDRKLLLESEAIFAAFIAKAKQEKPGLVLIPGDLTKDGEKVCHEKLATMLGELKAAGIKALVINGNHDVNNPHAMSYNGDVQTQVPSVTPEEFTTIYNDFGYSSALERDPNSLSYLSEPIPGLRVLALDVCLYNPSAVGGAISEATLTWAVAKITAARLAGKTIIGMMHHGLLEHYAGQKTFFPEYVIEDYQNVSATLLAAGLEVMFTGHYHSNDIVSVEADAGTLYDIETGSLVTWPCPHRVVTLNNKSISISTEHSTAIDGTVPGGVDFQLYAKDFLVQGLTGIATYMLMAPPYNVPQEYAVMIAPVFTNAMVAHYAGDETPSAQDQADMAMVAGIDPVLGAAIGTLWADLNPADNTLSITLK